MIQEGLLWFDDDPARALSDKITRAERRYQQKYGHAPDVCYVHPSALPGGELSVGQVRVLPVRTVLPYHFWLCVQDARSTPSKHSRFGDATYTDTLYTNTQTEGESAA
jgi:hypothetical protein